MKQVISVRLDRTCCVTLAKSSKSAISNIIECKSNELWKARLTWVLGSKHPCKAGTHPTYVQGFQTHHRPVRTLTLVAHWWIFSGVPLKAPWYAFGEAFDRHGRADDEDANTHKDSVYCGDHYFATKTRLSVAKYMNIVMSHFEHY